MSRGQVACGPGREQAEGPGCGVVSGLGGQPHPSTLAQARATCPQTLPGVAPSLTQFPVLASTPNADHLRVPAAVWEYYSMRAKDNMLFNEGWP